MMRSVRFSVALLVVALLLVPPLVRSVQRIDDSQSAQSLIRLTRGFDAPETKCRIAPPSFDSMIDVFVTHAPEIARVVEHAAPGDEPLPAPRFETGPDPLRGPPALLA
jgi:hypothetical protein